jgi:hypothetical protein
MATGKRGFGFRRFEKVSALTPLGQKHVVGIRIGNLLLSKRNKLTTEPHRIFKVETLWFMLLNIKNKVQFRKHVGSAFAPRA